MGIHPVGKVVIMAAHGVVDAVNSPDINKCVSCKELFEDVKTVIQCVTCQQSYHGKCENIDLRGFRMKRSTWKCRACTPARSEVMTDINKPERSRKRSRTEEVYVEATLVDSINAKLELLIITTNELNEKVDDLLAENNSLKEEILRMKESKISESKMPDKTYAYITKNDNKVLLIKQKSTQNDISIVERDLKNKVNPTEIGIGLSIGRPTKDGGIILNCTGQQEIGTIQSQIQDKLGDEYSVDRPKIKEHRIKVVGIEESEYNCKPEDIVEKIVKQNNIQQQNADFKLNVLRKTSIFNRRFNIIFEVDTKTYDLFTEMEKINIGWNRCAVYSDYGILRCFNCCKYGHISKECKEKTACPRCSEGHELKHCTSKTNKCINCVISNDK